MENTALIVIDVQNGFDDPRFGKRDNPDAEANIARLVAAWKRAGHPIVRVRHIAQQPDHPLGPDDTFKPVVADIQPELDIVKSVRSSFHGTPDLHAWLQATGIGQVAIAGIQTNMCCESTARVAGDLGYRMLFALDATHTFDKGDLGADDLARATATNLDPQFGRVVTTESLVAMIS